MQLPWDEHFFEIVLPAWQAYLAAESDLAQAVKADDELRTSRARYRALREAGCASFYVHHFADVVLRARPHWLPHEVSNLGAVRHWLSTHCTALRTNEPTNDVKLLGDVADALKHAILTRQPDKRLVAANEAVLIAGATFGEGRYGEGKFGGTQQVLVLSTEGQRALSAVLQNVVDAWRRAGKLKVPAVGEA